MASIAKTQNQNLPHQPYLITKEIFTALDPLKKAAALALEKYGHVRIVENDVNAFLRQYIIISSVELRLLTSLPSETQTRRLSDPVREEGDIISIYRSRLGCSASAKAPLLAHID